MITRELMEKFLRNGCDPEEKARIALYLQEHPETLEKYLIEEEWESFETTGDLSPEISEKLFSRILKDEQKNGRSRIIVLKRWVAAASFLLLMTAGWMFFTHRSHVIPLVAANTVTPATPEDSLQHQWNNGADKMTVVLKDGSSIELYPESGISYSKKWNAPQRVIYLKGKARFSVAREKNRPFIVYSDEIATTVLGTSFTVTSFDRDNTIKVGLHEGKVVVRSADPALGKRTGDLFLSPGDLLLYNKKSKLAQVLTPRENARHLAAGNNSAAPPEWYMFKSQSLDQVFDQLSLYYGVEIDYFPSDTRNRYFTGRYENRDSVGGILKDIALLNGLSIIMADGKYTVKKIIH
jgi:transmembrane sensor